MVAKHKTKPEPRVFWHDGMWEIRSGHTVLARCLMIADVLAWFAAHARASRAA